MITIDGSLGEGGGQILRSSLALSLITKQPFRIENIRAGRKNPGLLRQHLTGVNAAATIGNANVSGDSIGSTELTFNPGEVKAGEYSFAVGTAGSATLVLQTVLPALMIGNKITTLTLEGGTHNPFAPPFDFLQKTFLPILKTMGVEVETQIEKYGFYPAGGGKFSIKIIPAAQLKPFNLIERGEITAKTARALVAHIPYKVAEREISVLGRKLEIPEENRYLETIKTSPGPGNVAFVEIASQHVTEVFSGFGERGVTAEAVANSIVKDARNYLNSEAVAGEYLADQLLIPMALAGGGTFMTMPLSQHSKTNIEVIKQFLEVDFLVEKIGTREWKVELKSP